MSVFSSKYTPKGVQELTLSDSSQKLTVPSGANAAFIQVQKGDGTFTEDTEIMRYNFDDADATVSTGLILGNLDFFEIQNKAQLEAFNCISAETGQGGKIYVQYFNV